jgi:hypothetical protein
MPRLSGWKAEASVDPGARTPNGITTHHEDWKTMSDTLIAPPAASMPIRVPAVMWVVAMTALFASYLMLGENGALLASSWELLHESFHDGRHAFGIPCH